MPVISEIFLINVEFLLYVEFVHFIFLVSFKFLPFVFEKIMKLCMYL